VNAINKLKFITSAYRVQRYHTSSRVKEKQLLGQHSAGVAMAYVVLCQTLGQGIDPNGVLVALTHDMGEFYTGDMPAPAKRAMNLRDAFDAAENKARSVFGVDFGCGEQTLQLVKIADAIDGMLHCLWEANGGNRAALAVFDVFNNYVSELLEPAHGVIFHEIVVPLQNVAYNIRHRRTDDQFDTGIGFDMIHD
jgi:5'-deoxynucleotidase YfbR-like HD superfamily hydrolase